MRSTQWLNESHTWSSANVHTQQIQKRYHKSWEHVFLKIRRIMMMSSPSGTRSSRSPGSTASTPAGDAPLERRRGPYRRARLRRRRRLQPPENHRKQIWMRPRCCPRAQRSRTYLACPQAAWEQRGSANPRGLSREMGYRVTSAIGGRCHIDCIPPGDDAAPPCRACPVLQSKMGHAEATEHASTGAAPFRDKLAFTRTAEYMLELTLATWKEAGRQRLLEHKLRHSCERELLPKGRRAGAGVLHHFCGCLLRRPAAGGRRQLEHIPRPSGKRESVPKGRRAGAGAFHRSCMAHFASQKFGTCLAGGGG